MNKSKIILIVSTLVLTTFSEFSCNIANKEKVTSSTKSVTQVELNAKGITVFNEYFNLKDALVNDNNSAAKELGSILEKSLKSFDVSNFSDSEKTKLKDIIDHATKHTKQMSEADIKQQREHFKKLSKYVTALVAITGTDIKLYEQFCPMYDGGSAWLSTNEEIRNPYYGSKMLKCGIVKREINKHE